MEPTSRRFAVFLASGLSLAVVVGLLVWKISDSGMNLSNQNTEMAGHPIAAADADDASTRKTAVSSETSSVAAEDTGEAGGELAAVDADTGAGNAATNGNSGAANGGAGAAYDPLAPRNANLGGARGGSQEMSYYRPTNAAPAPQNARTSAPAQTQQPNHSGSTTAEQSVSPRTTSAPHSTTAVPQEPEEPQRASEEAANGATPPKQEPQRPAAEAEAAGKELASQIAEKALNTSDAVVDAAVEHDSGDTPKRPEDPFSASTRIPQAPAEN